MLHLLKKLKLYTKVGSESVHKTSISIQIKIYLWSFVDYQHLQKYSYNWNMILNYCSIYNINIRGNFIWKYPSSNFHISARLSHLLWKKKQCTSSTNDYVLQSFEAFLINKISFFYFIPCSSKISQHKKYFLRNLDPHNSRLFLKENWWFVAGICLIWKLTECTNDHSPDASIILTF